MLAALSTMVGCAGASVSGKHPASNVPQADAVRNADHKSNSKTDEANRGGDEKIKGEKNKNINKKGKSYYNKKPWYLRTPLEERKRRERKSRRNKLVMNYRVRMLNYM